MADKIDSRERVALELMIFIRQASDKALNTREEILTLYRQCYKAVQGEDLTQISTKEEWLKDG